MLILENNKLEQYKEQQLKINPKWHERDFTAVVRSYLESSTEKVLAVSGLRGTGKTVGCLQAAVYVLAQAGEDKTGKDYIELLKTTDKKNIIIDEYSWIRDRKDLDRYLMTAVQNGKRIVIMATESITLDFLNYGALNHRVHVVHTTMFPYGEYLRLYDKTHSKENCIAYLQEGGLFREYAIKNYDDAKRYIEEAIVGNLAGYLKDEMSEEKARTLTYAVLYKAICPSNLSSIPTLRRASVTMDNYLDRMGVNTALIPEQWDLNRVADIFEQIGLIVRIPNYNRESDLREQYYIVNPSLTCQLIKHVYGLERIENSILGHVFESCVGVQLATNRLEEHDIYFYNNEGPENHNENRELDFIITDRKNEFAYFFECKFSQNDSLHTDITLLSGYLESHEFDGVEIEGRYVVYNGKPAVQSWEGIGDIVFIPISDTLNNYFEFEQNIDKILYPEEPVKDDRDQDDHEKPEKPVSPEVQETVDSIAGKVRKLTSGLDEFIGKERTRIAESFRRLERRLKKQEMDIGK